MPVHIVKDVEGEKTELLIQQFGDRWLILVTQMGKVGNLIQASLPSTASLSFQTSNEAKPAAALPEPPVSIVLTPLMGTAQDADHKTLLDIYASQISTLVWTSSPTPSSLPVVVGLALRRKKGPIEAEDSEFGVNESSRQSFFAIMDMVRDGLVQLNAR